MRNLFWVLLVALPMAMTAKATEDRGPAVRQGGQIGELRTFIAGSLSSSGTLVLTAPAQGWFTILEVCANTTKSANRDINVSVFAGDLHLATLTEEQGGDQPKCIEFTGGFVLPRNVGVTCEGGGNHECWITGICSRDCNVP